MEDPSIRKIISYAIWELPKGHVELPETRVLTVAGKQCVPIFGVLVQYFGSLLTLHRLTICSRQETKGPF